MILYCGFQVKRWTLSPVRLNSGFKFSPLTSIFAELLSSVFHVISCDERWWSKLEEATESLQKLTGNFASGSRGASGRGSVLGGRGTERRASPGREGPCPRCVSAQGGSVSVATVASENGFRKLQADCQLSADRSGAEKAWRRLKLRRWICANPLISQLIGWAETATKHNFCFQCFRCLWSRRLWRSGRV